MEWLAICWPALLQELSKRYIAKKESSKYGDINEKFRSIKGVGKQIVIKSKEMKNQP